MGQTALASVSSRKRRPQSLKAVPKEKAVPRCRCRIRFESVSRPDRSRENGTGRACTPLAPPLAVPLGSPDWQSQTGRVRGPEDLMESCYISTWAKPTSIERDDDLRDGDGATVGGLSLANLASRCARRCEGRCDHFQRGQTAG